MPIKTIPQLLAEHPILGGFDDEARGQLAGCARNRHSKRPGRSTPSPEIVFDL